MTKETQETRKTPPKFRLGPLKTLHQVLKANGKTIRAMANGTLKTEDGSRIANALSIQRQIIESQVLQRLEQRMTEMESGDSEFEPSEPRTDKPARLPLQ